MQKHKIPFIIASKCTENEIIFLELVLNSKWNEAKSFFQNIEKMRNSCNIISHLFYCCLSAYVCDRWWNGLLICKILPQSEKDGFLSILQFLLDKGAEINRINIAETPLFPASISLQPFLVSFLLQKGASPQILSTSNRSVLSRVYFKFAREICWNRRKKYIHELIKMGTEVLVLLIEHGATPYHSDASECLLESIASLQLPDLVETLLHHGIHFDIETETGKNAIRRLIMKDDIDTLRLLLENGTSPIIPIDHNLCAYDFAVEHKKKKSMSIIAPYYQSANKNKLSASKEKVKRVSHKMKAPSNTICGQYRIDINETILFQKRKAEKYFGKLTKKQEKQIESTWKNNASELQEIEIEITTNRFILRNIIDEDEESYCLQFKVLHNTTIINVDWNGIIMFEVHEIKPGIFQFLCTNEDNDISEAVWKNTLDLNQSI